MERAVFWLAASVLLLSLAMVLPAGGWAVSVSGVAGGIAVHVLGLLSDLRRERTSNDFFVHLGRRAALRSPV